jgi:Phytanoyl-CoA dioxygenase (PhyH)
MDLSGIRTVTADEVAHFREHGWSKLDQLLSPELAAVLLERAKRVMGPDGLEHVTRDGVDLDFPWWHDYNNIVEADEGFAAVGLSPQMGVNAQRLIRRRTGVLLWSNRVAVKIGTGQASPHTSEPTCIHQDAPEIPMDRASWVRFWIALDHITADMGRVRFVDRSHLLGLVGNTHFEREDVDPDAALFEAYPELVEMRITDPVEFQPGDAMVHTMYTLHTAPTNETDKPRWTLIYSYFADDTVYTGSRCEDDNARKLRNAGIVPGQLFADAGFPRVCDPVMV